MSKRIYWVIGILCVVGLGFVAYSFIAPCASKPKHGNLYKMAIPDVISSLNPRKVIWDIEKSSMSLIYDPLIQVGNEYSFKPAICKSWIMDSENTRFECVIREGVKFHNGKNVSIDDIIFSLNYVLANGGLDLEDFKYIKGINEYWSGRSSNIIGIYALSKEKLVIELNEKCPSFVFVLASPRIVVLPKDLLGQSEEIFFKKPVGSGPFMLEHYDINKIILTSYKDYYKGKSYLDGIEILTMDSITALDAFKAGHVYDLRFYDFSSEAVKDIDIAKSIPTIRNSSVILYPNNSIAPFSDEKMRRLLFSLVDKDETLNSCGLSHFNLQSAIPRGIAGYEKVIENNSYNLVNGLKLAEKLKKAGYQFQPVKIYYNESDDTNKCIAEKANKHFELAEIPWQIIAETSDKMVKIFFDGKMNADIEGVYAKNEDAYNILRYFMSDNPENIAKINDKTVDEMLKTALNADNSYEKTKIYKKIVRRILDEEYIYPLYEKNDVSIFNKKVMIADDTLNNPYFINFAKVWLQ